MSSLDVVVHFLRISAFTVGLIFGIDKYGHHRDALAQKHHDQIKLLKDKIHERDSRIVALTAQISGASTEE
eukprot:TRINITY_DN41971_c3_g1_i1.p1 TRINITY_DN41971_c3_g1~~TRINITY_DN41971_c3_g1_i1.p1  ORF type:complete len:71 (-),score=9.10 TRINITY_DN41971_c3_g1_i1:156-368(-)